MDTYNGESIDLPALKKKESIDLPPGFRFDPSDEEIIAYYLTGKTVHKNFNAIAGGEADLVMGEPWDLPCRAKMGEKSWYFFCAKDRKYPTGSRTNRATGSGYWKATGKDKDIHRGKALVGMKKHLPKASKLCFGQNEWVMAYLHCRKLTEVPEKEFLDYLSNTAPLKSSIHISPQKCSQKQFLLQPLPCFSQARKGGWSKILVAQATKENFPMSNFTIQQLKQHDRFSRKKPARKFRGKPKCKKVRAARSDFSMMRCLKVVNKLPEFKECDMEHVLEIFSDELHREAFIAMNKSQKVFWLQSKIEEGQ